MNKRTFFKEYRGTFPDFLPGLQKYRVYSVSTDDAGCTFKVYINEAEAAIQDKAKDPKAAVLRDDTGRCYMHAPGQAFLKSWPLPDEDPAAEAPVAAPASGEHDPHGTAANTPGAKLDAGKPRMGLVLGGFAGALREVAEVGTDGAAKYSDNGWKVVPDGFNRYTDAMLRHWADEADGPIDAKSGSRHAAHVAWNALARLQLLLNEEAKGNA